MIELVLQQAAELSNCIIHTADFGISAIIMAAIATASAAASAANQRSASKKTKQYNEDRQGKLDAKAAQDNAWYRMQYYKDPTRTPDGANMLKTMREYNDNLIARQRNRGVITGATHEQTVATAGRAMQNYGKTLSDMRATNERTKTGIAAQWQQARNTAFNNQLDADAAVQQQIMQSHENTNNNINNFTNAATQFTASLAASGDSGGSSSSSSSGSQAAATTTTSPLLTSTQQTPNQFQNWQQRLYKYQNYQLGQGT